MFSLSGPCKLLFLCCLLGVVVRVMLYPCIVCVALLDLQNSLVKLYDAANGKRD